MNARLLRGVAGLVGLFLIWEAVCRAGLVDPVLLPAPTTVLARVVSLLGDAGFLRALLATLLTWLLSLAITIAIAVPVGILLGSVPGVRTATSALVDLIRPIPAVALVPIAIILLGAGPISTIALAVFAGIWPLLFNVVGAIRETDPMLVETARTFGLRRFAIAARVRMPSVARSVVVGVRIAVSLELIVIVSVGLLAALNGGIGEYLWDQAETVGDQRTVLAGTLVVGLLGYLANQGLLALEGIRVLHPTTTGVPEAGRGRRPHWLARLATQLVVLAGVVLVWQLITVWWHNIYAPTPTRIAATAWQNAGLFAANLPVSLARMGIGLGIAVVVGAGLGIVLGSLPRVADVIEPVGGFVRAIPPVLLLPVLEIWTHVGTPQFEIVSVALGCAWPILVQTIEGVRSIEPVLLDTSRGYRTGTLRHLYSVVTPAAAPKILTGLRIAVSLALILMVISEELGETVGLGAQLELAGSQFEFPLMWACFLLLGVLGYLVNQLVVAADVRLVSWRHETVDAE